MTVVSIRVRNSEVLLELCRHFSWSFFAKLANFLKVSFVDVFKGCEFTPTAARQEKRSMYIFLVKNKLH